MPTKKQKQKAKDLSREVWQYLFDHPTIESKIYLLPELYMQICALIAECPLCELYYRDEKNGNCNKACPIAKISPCNKINSYYDRWKEVRTFKTRKKYAGLILDIIKAWKV